MATSSPSPELRARIEAEIAESAAAYVDGDLKNWPRRIERDEHVLLVHGEWGYLFFLSPDGALFELDTERSAQRLEPVPEFQRAKLLRAACEHRPWLSPLLDP